MVSITGKEKLRIAACLHKNCHIKTKKVADKPLAAVLVLPLQNWLLGLLIVYRDRGGCRLGESFAPALCSGLMSTSLMIYHQELFQWYGLCDAESSAGELPFVDESSSGANGSISFMNCGTERNASPGYIQGQKVNSGGRQGGLTAAGRTFFRVFINGFMSQERCDREKSFEKSRKRHAPVFCLIRIDNIQEVTAEVVM